MTNPVPFEVDDAIVLLLGAPANSPILQGRLPGITRLEKLVFLLERETPLGQRMTEPLDFIAHNFGPFSQKVYQGIEMLSSAGLVTDSAAVAATEEDSWESDEIIGDNPDTRYTTRDFELTNRGRQYYKAFLAELPDDTEAIVSEIKNRFGGLPLRQLIRYVYTRYPDLTERSLIKEQILGQGR
jgi:hypothetical protein